MINAYRDAHELEQAITELLELRPSLGRQEARDQITRLARNTVYDWRFWVQICRDQVRAGRPMPWERGYLEREYLSLLAKQED